MSKITKNDFIFSDSQLDELNQIVDKTYGMENVTSIIFQLPLNQYELHKDKIKWCNFISGADLKFKFGTIQNHKKLNIIVNNEYDEPKIFVLLKKLDDPILINS